jgi:TRAP-type C4-dicarboxylate transport system permease small subunit
MTTAPKIGSGQSPVWLAYERVIQAMAVLGAIIFVLATILVLTEICARYFFRRPIIGAVEITEYCLVWITFLAAPWVQSRGGNVKVEFIVDLLRPRVQAFLRAATALFAAATCAVLTYAGFETVWSHYEMGYDLSTPLHPPSAPIIAIIPISMLLLTIQFAREAVLLWRDARGG